MLCLDVVGAPPPVLFSPGAIEASPIYARWRDGLCGEEETESDSGPVGAILSIDTEVWHRLRRSFLAEIAIGILVLGVLLVTDPERLRSLIDRVGQIVVQLAK